MKNLTINKSLQVDSLKRRVLQIAKIRANEYADEELSVHSLAEIDNLFSLLFDKAGGVIEKLFEQIDTVEDKSIRNDILRRAIIAEMYDVASTKDEREKADEEYVSFCDDCSVLIDDSVLNDSGGTTAILSPTGQIKIDAGEMKIIWKYNGFGYVARKNEYKERRFLGKKDGLYSCWGDIILPCVFDSIYSGGWSSDLSFEFNGSVFQCMRLYPSDMFDYEFLRDDIEMHLNRLRGIPQDFMEQPELYLPAFIVPWGNKTALFKFGPPLIDSENAQNMENRKLFQSNLKEVVRILKQYHKQVQP